MDGSSGRRGGTEGEPGVIYKNQCEDCDARLTSRETLATCSEAGARWRERGASPSAVRVSFDADLQSGAPYLDLEVNAGARIREIYCKRRAECTHRSTASFTVHLLLHTLGCGGGLATIRIHCDRTLYSATIPVSCTGVHTLPPQAVLAP